MNIQKKPRSNTEIQSLDSELDLENVPSSLDMDKAFNYVVRMLRNSYVTKYIEDHPAAYDEVVTAVQKIPRPKSLPTPASTSCYTGSLGEQTSTSLPSQHITQEEELDSDDQTDQYENLFESHDHNSPAVRQELNHKSRRLYQAYAKNADDSEPEQTTGESQRSANLGVRPPTDHNDDIYDRDACQEGTMLF